MTLTLNDTIELLKAILEECGVDCFVLIISLIVVGWTVSFPSFNAIKTHRISFALSPFSCCFYENFDKIYQEIPCFTPFIHPLTPLVFAFWRGEKCYRNHFFLLLRALRSRSLRSLSFFNTLKVLYDLLWKSPLQKRVVYGLKSSFFSEKCSF